MAAQDEKPGKIFYSMGEVAEMLDVSHSLIRFWEGQFDILKPKRNKKGNRMFSPDDVRNLKIIYHLVRERGMTLPGAQKYMKAGRKEIERDMELAERLAAIRSLLAEVRDALGTDGTVMEEVFREPVTTDPADMPIGAGSPAYEHEELAVGVVEETVVSGTITREDIDALMREAIAEVEDDEPEEMPDFTPESVFPEDEEVSEDETTEEAPKPLFIEQTLFDL